MVFGKNPAAPSASACSATDRGAVPDRMATGVSGFAALDLQQVVPGTVQLVLADGSVITLAGASVQNLAADDFLFA